LVQGWISGTIANNGLEFRALGGTSGDTFASREGGPTPPQLFISYVIIPEPSTMVLWAGMSMVALIWYGRRKTRRIAV
jgi:hypothetical protein